MIDALNAALRKIGAHDWPDVLEPLIQQRLSPIGHGDFARWQETLLQLQADAGDARELLLELSPWRKGPMIYGDIEIDAEWRSDLKWARICDSIAPLDGRNVLDIGCGNGYYALQMADLGAAYVIGIDPTILFVMQFLAINQTARADNVFVVPARAEELPTPARCFDTTFSMGVLYHQRSPIEHLRQLRQTLRPDGQLVLETLYLPGDEAFAKTPEDRYARMRNVWLLPSLTELQIWLGRTGYKDVEIIDTSITTVAEQRSTEWMTFESLREALDPKDSSRTVEGWPAPHRVVITATAP